jgi:hypothetical protein
VICGLQTITSHRRMQTSGEIESGQYVFVVWDDWRKIARCTIGFGRRMTVEVLTFGGLPKSTTADDLIGKTLEVEDLTPFIQVAPGVRIAEDRP